MSAADIEDLLANFTHSAWRMEALQDYDEDPDDPQWVAFNKGEPIPPRDDRDWLDLVAGHAKAGREVGRVRVIEQPLSPYTRYELAVYPENVDAGEAIRIVDRADLADLEPLPLDFWMFDESIVALMEYDEAGSYLRSDLASDVEPFKRLQRELLRRSVPFADFS